MGESGFRRALLILGHGVFLALFVLAAQHAELRFLQADSAYQFVKWLAQDGVNIEAHRYTAIIPQLIVKALTTIPVGLRALLLAASIAHVAVAYAVFVLCAHVWKAWRSAVGCALAAVLCSRLAFYSPVLEANYLISFPFLLFGHIEHHSVRPWTVGCTFIAVALLLVTLMVHPAGWTIMLFGIVILSMMGVLPKGRALLMSGVCVAWPLLSHWVFPPTEYERAQFVALADGLRHINELFHWASWQFIRMHLYEASFAYLPAALLLTCVLVAWCWRREWPIAGMTVLGTLAYLMLYLVTFHRGDAGIMMDRGVLPVATIIALSMAWAIPDIPSDRLKAAVVAILVTVSFVKLRDISFASRPFDRERATLDHVIAKVRALGASRALVAPDQLVGTSYGWSLPYASLLLSSRKGPTNSNMLVNEGLRLEEQFLDQEGQFLFTRSSDTTRRSLPWFALPAGPWRTLE